ncbi:hypothetical protein [Flavobacterium subsaxonicum]|uniref:Uncharacterized protein n=1 Tax=Flavobacterium subsaxonicum WB 4.1-42 = DSM 21790 TaxID=1121898 RepID=A0A0A2MQ46_9FLAO|nr:hypothetical protein [Flavobacterium subsaxonicum]KGO94797.1 hypothetical protein Q766_01400 [Flavobacterium subsaxonicum WB 4.1-42 = DSM 21790]
MDIIFKDKGKNIISEEHAIGINEYYKAFYKNDVLILEEYYYNTRLAGMDYYNFDNQDHKSILDTYLQDYKDVGIVEYTPYTNGYKLTTTFGYNEDGLYVTNLDLYNPEGELIGHQSLYDGVPDYYHTRKYYYNREENPEKYLFECTYREETGELWELDWNNEHINNSGQDSFVLTNTPKDIEALLALTGMSRELADYYMNSNVVPDFAKK